MKESRLLDSFQVFLLRPSYASVSFFVESVMSTIVDVIAWVSFALLVTSVLILLTKVVNFCQLFGLGRSKLIQLKQFLTPKEVHADEVQVSTTSTEPQGSPDPLNRITC